MDAVDIDRAIMGALFSAACTIVAVFVNLASGKAETSVLGVGLPARQVHFVLGSFLVLLNAYVFVCLCALYRVHVGSNQLAHLQDLSQYKILGPLFNPFYTSDKIFAKAVAALGYAFLIILWWLGFYSFSYSVGPNESADSPFLFGWRMLISILYLVLGLLSMLAIQQCWRKFDFASYQLKWLVGFLGILIGASVPPLILGHRLSFGWLFRFF